MAFFFGKLRSYLVELFVNEIRSFQNLRETERRGPQERGQSNKIRLATDQASIAEAVR
jgi:hypothetical protein